MIETKPDGYVLIADDDLDDIEMLTSALHEAVNDIQILVAANGKDVLTHLRDAQLPQGLPCILVMDMNMPQMDGRETVVAIKTNDLFKDLPILLFSTAKNKTDALFAEKWSVHYKQKPDTVQGLRDVAQEIIDMCREKV